MHKKKGGEENLNNDSGNQLVNLIREITKIEISKEDTTCICQVDSINSDGTANIIIIPDMETKINNIQNNSNNEIASGDFVVLYKIKNQINNSFIMAKCGKSVQKSREKVVMVNYNQSEPSQIVQNAVLYTPQSLTDAQKLQARTNIGIMDGGGDKSFIFSKDVPSAIWDIKHDLDKYPCVTVIDSGGTVVLGCQIKYIDKNNLTLEFSASFSGKAYLN